MSVFKNGRFYHFEFKVDGRRRRGSTGTANKQLAIQEERRQRERLEKSYGQVIEEEAREQRRKTIKFAADEFLIDYEPSTSRRSTRNMPSGMRVMRYARMINRLEACDLIRTTSIPQTERGSDVSEQKDGLGLRQLRTAVDSLPDTTVQGQPKKLNL
jgi:hypothetical protein